MEGEMVYILCRDFDADDGNMRSSTKECTGFDILSCFKECMGCQSCPRKWKKIVGWGCDELMKSHYKGTQILIASLDKRHGFVSMLDQSLMYSSGVSHRFQPSYTGPVVLRSKSGLNWTASHKVLSAHFLPMEASQRHESHPDGSPKPLTVSPENIHARVAALGRSRSRIVGKTCENLVRTGNPHYRGGI